MRESAAVIPSSLSPTTLGCDLVCVLGGAWPSKRWQQPLMLGCGMRAAECGLRMLLAEGSPLTLETREGSGGAWGLERSQRWQWGSIQAR